MIVRRSYLSTKIDAIPFLQLANVVAESHVLIFLVEYIGLRTYL